MRPIDYNFGSWLQTTLNNNAGLATMALSPTLPTPDLYRLLVPDEEVRSILQQAARVLAPVRTIRDNDFELFCTHPSLDIATPLQFTLTMPVPKDWETILFPGIKKGWRPIISANADQEITSLLMPSLKVAQQWAHLEYVVVEMMKLVNDRQTIADMFPWIPELIKESDWWNKRGHFYRYNNITMQRAKERVDQTFTDAMQPFHTMPKRMSRNIRDICLSGSMLFSQLRMLKAVKGDDIEMLIYRTMNSSSIVPHINKPALISKTVQEDMEAIKTFNQFS
jgi:hypothetical protein